jgi:hypothetical protein
MRKKFKKEEIFFIDMFFYLYIDGDSNFMQFYYYLIVHQRPLITIVVNYIKI